jgi:hypothetical protein
MYERIFPLFIIPDGNARSSKKRVDKGRHGGAFRKNDQQAQQ